MRTLQTRNDVKQQEAKEEMKEEKGKKLKNHKI
jgi:hypothetical protein